MTPQTASRVEAPFSSPPFRFVLAQLKRCQLKQLDSGLIPVRKVARTSSSLLSGEGVNTMEVSSTNREVNDSTQTRGAEMRKACHAFSTVHRNMVATWEVR